MKCTTVLAVSNEELEVIKRFVSVMERSAISTNGDDVWNIMKTIASRSTYGVVIGIKIVYEESEE